MAVAVEVADQRDVGSADRGSRPAERAVWPPEPDVVGQAARPIHEHIGPVVAVEVPDQRGDPSGDGGHFGGGRGPVGDRRPLAGFLRGRWHSQRLQAEQARK